MANFENFDHFERQLEQDGKDMITEEKNNEYMAKIDMPYIENAAQHAYKKENGEYTRDKNSLYPYLRDAFKKQYADALKMEEVPGFIKKMEEMIEDLNPEK